MEEKTFRMNLILSYLSVKSKLVEPYGHKLVPVMSHKVKITSPQIHALPSLHPGFLIFKQQFTFYADYSKNKADGTGNSFKKIIDYEYKQYESMNR